MIALEPRMLSLLLGLAPGRSKTIHEIVLAEHAVFSRLVRVVRAKHLIGSVDILPAVKGFGPHLCPLLRALVWPSAGAVQCRCLHVAG